MEEKLLYQVISKEKVPYVPFSIELDPESDSHLFRHVSEITKETKGGKFPY